MRLVLVSDSFIPKGPWELLCLVQAHRSVFRSVKLALIKYEKSFVPRHVKSDEGLLESLLISFENVLKMIHSLIRGFAVRNPYIQNMP